jgi:CheY-like chemotaxis protein
MAALRVLIADDDLLVRMILERHVIKWGHQFISATNGEAACQLLQSQPIDVCILDWEMPELTGLEVCKWLNASGVNEAAHVIMNTSKARPEDIQLAYEAGANDYIKKPTDLSYLRRKLAVLAESMQKVEAEPQLDAEPDLFCLNQSFLPN